ncbi:MAG: hypothetical protein ABFS86_16655 [Planctomycetota bacterium]
MDRIARREFRGNWGLFTLLCLTVVGIPRAVLYLVEGTIEIQYEVDDAEEFLRHHFGRRD